MTKIKFDSRGYSQFFQRDDGTIFLLSKRFEDSLWLKEYLGVERLPMIYVGEDNIGCISLKDAQQYITDDLISEVDCEQTTKARTEAFHIEMTHTVSLMYTAIQDFNGPKKNDDLWRPYHEIVKLIESIRLDNS